ncbi:alpha/beta hydrolase [bacterium]|nr:alpha/beta hydrolase [bacterium]
MAQREINGTRLEVVEHGSGDPVLFAHGSASDHRTWQGLLGVFATRYRTIAYSRRYHWPNDRIPDDADYSMGEQVDDLAALLRSLAAGPVHLVGHSYGAFVALLLAVREPQLVRSLVLAEPPVITLFVSSRPKPSELLRLLFRRPRTATAIVRFGATGIVPATAAARRGDMDDAMRIFGRAVLGAEFHGNLSSARLEQVRANAIRSEFTGSGFPPLRDADLRALSIPTLLISGERSPALFHRLLDRLEELLPYARRVEIPGASHIMYEDNAPACHAAIRSFLAEPDI